MKYPDPFVEKDSRWQPSPTSVECGLTDNFRDFLREQERTAITQQPKPVLPDGIKLQRLTGNRWGLLYPDGASGYRIIESDDYEELIDLAQRITTTP